MHADRVQFDSGGADHDKVVVVTLASATNGGLWLVSRWYFHRLDFFESGITGLTNRAWDMKPVLGTVNALN